MVKRVLNSDAVQCNVVMEMTISPLRDFCTIKKHCETHSQGHTHACVCMCVVIWYIPDGRIKVSMETFILSTKKEICWKLKTMETKGRTVALWTWKNAAEEQQKNGQGRGRKNEKKNNCIECIITPNSGHCFTKCDGHFCNNKVDAVVADMLACLHVEVKHQSNLIQKPEHSHALYFSMELSDWPICWFCLSFFALSLSHTHTHTHSFLSYYHCFTCMTTKNAFRYANSQINNLINSFNRMLLTVIDYRWTKWT